MGQVELTWEIKRFADHVLVFSAVVLLWTRCVSRGTHTSLAALPFSLPAGCQPTTILNSYIVLSPLPPFCFLSQQSFHPLFMGPDYIGPAVDHFQEITAQY
ncbi:unnamed protein product, partial [Laminaria digitata]